MGCGASNDGPALLGAIDSGDVDTVKTLLEKNPKLIEYKKKGAHRDTLLILALFAEKTEVVKLLIEKGANVDMPATGGLTPVYFAAVSGNIEALKALDEKKAKLLGRVETTDINTIPPAFAIEGAARYGHIECVKFLLEKNPDTQKTYLGRALCFACQGSCGGDSQANKVACVTALIAAGANVNEAVAFQMTDQFTSPLVEASSCSNHEKVQLLLGGGAKKDLVPFNEGAAETSKGPLPTDAAKAEFDKWTGILAKGVGQDGSSPLTDEDKKMLNTNIGDAKKTMDLLAGAK